MTLVAAAAVLGTVAPDQPLSGASGLRGAVARSYVQWLGLKGVPFQGAEVQVSGWVQRYSDLFRNAAVSPTCRSVATNLQCFAERRRVHGAEGFGLASVAPFAMLAAGRAYRQRFGFQAVASDLFRIAGDIASITCSDRGHRLSAGVFAVTLGSSLAGNGLAAGIAVALDELVRHRNHAATLAALRQAERSAAAIKAHPAVLRRVCVDSSAPAILSGALYCALSADDFESAMALAGYLPTLGFTLSPLVGQLWGANRGSANIPSRWLGHTRLRQTLLRLADDIEYLGCREAGGNAAVVETFRQRYPRI